MQAQLEAQLSNKARIAQEKEFLGNSSRNRQRKRHRTHFERK